MAGVAQLVRASDCGPEGRWFDSSHPPQICGYRTAVSIQVFQTWDEVSTTSTRTSEIFGLVVRYYRGGGLFFVGKLMCYNETGGHLAKFI